MYEELYEELSPQMLQEYLQRIGVDPQEIERELSQGLDKVVLDKLIYAHQCSVPFETLDTCGSGGDISLATADVFDKLVTRRRGGFCFELSGLFDKLLRGVGYKTISCLARAVIRRDYLPPNLHRLSFVEIDGDLYLADVGFGGPVPASALKLEEGDQTDAVGERFSLVLDENGWWMLSRHTADGLQKILCFNTIPQIEVDFVTANYYCANAPDSHFVINRIVSMRRPNGSVQIFNDLFKVIENGELVIEREIESDEDRRALLSEYFGIEGV